MRAFAYALTALVAAAVAVPGQAASDDKNRVVTIENVSSRTVREVYASPSDHDTWEEDMLGADTLDSGETMRFNIDNGTTECLYDLKAVLENDKEYVRRKVDVCKVSKWVIGDAGDSLL